MEDRHVRHETLSPDLARFAPLARLKQGDHGTVALLRERESGVLVVGRRFNVTTPEQLPPLIQTFNQLNQFEHRRIQPTTELMESDTGVWCISDFVPGYPLDYLASQRSHLEVRHVVLWMNQMLEGLQALHEAQLPMGTLDPTDVVIGVQGASFVDLRIFEHAWPERAALRALRGSSGSFSAPESFTAFHADHRSDLYSVAALAFWLLTGQEPEVRAQVDRDLMGIHLKHARPDLPAELLVVLIDMLHFHLGQRPQSAQEVVQRLEPFVGDDFSLMTLYAVMPMLSEQMPVPWLPAEAMWEDPGAPQTLKKAARPAPAATALPPLAPVAAAAPRPIGIGFLEALDDWGWLLFRGDLRRLGVAVALMIVVCGGFVVAARSPLPRAATPPAPAPPSLMHVVAGRIYVRADAHSGWGTQGLIDQPGQGVLASSRSSSNTLAFGHGSSLRLGPAASFTFGGEWRLQSATGQVSVTTGANDTVTVNDLSVTPNSEVDFDFRPVSRRPHLQITCKRGSVDGLTAGQQRSVDESR